MFSFWGYNDLVTAKWCKEFCVSIRDETIYIDTVSIRRVTIRIVAERDISRYDLDIYKEGKSLRCLYFSYPFKKYNLCRRCWCSMPVEMDL